MITVALTIQLTGPRTFAAVDMFSPAPLRIVDFSLERFGLNTCEFGRCGGLDRGRGSAPMPHGSMMKTGRNVRFRRFLGGGDAGRF
jgi:hypothetical protein